MALKFRSTKIESGEINFQANQNKIVKTVTLDYTPMDVQEMAKYAFPFTGTLLSTADSLCCSPVGTMVMPACSFRASSSILSINGSGRELEYTQTLVTGKVTLNGIQAVTGTFTFTTDLNLDGCYSLSNIQFTCSRDSTSSATDMGAFFVYWYDTSSVSGTTKTWTITYNILNRNGYVPNYLYYTAYLTDYYD